MLRAQVNCRGDPEVTIDAVGIPQSLLLRPGDHDFIPHILIDVSLACDDGGGDVVEEVIEKMMVRDIPKFFRNSGGGLQVEEHEDPFLFHRLVILARDVHQQRIAAEQLVHLPDEVDEEARDQRIDHDAEEFTPLEKILKLGVLEGAGERRIVHP